MVLGTRAEASGERRRAVFGLLSSVIGWMRVVSLDDFPPSNPCVLCGALFGTVCDVTTLESGFWAQQGRAFVRCCDRTSTGS